MTPDQPESKRPELEETVLKPSQSPSRRSGDAENRKRGTCVSHYRIERRLGAGGMGQVYLVQDVALGRPAALKVLPDSFSPALQERLFREAWASARVQHPAIATFYEAGEDDGVAFIAMEYVEGQTLKEEIDKYGPIPLERAIKWTSVLLEGLAHAHAAEILHRDIKPTNIMCSADGSVRLLDFGLARQAEQLSDTAEVVHDRDLSDVVECGETLDYAPDTSSPSGQCLDPQLGLTKAGTILGTFGYMSPEQFHGQSVDGRTDIFATGALLFEMLSGEPAFAGATMRQRMHATLHVTPPDIDVGEKSAEVNRIIQRATAKKASERYQSVSQFLRDLRALGASSMADAKLDRVAILDFRNRADCDELDWLSTGLAEMLSEQLVQRGVKTLPRSVITATTQAVVGTEMEVGLHLGARWLVTGDLTQAAGTVTMRAQLLDVPALRVEQEFEICEPRDDLLGMHEKLAIQLVERLRPADVTNAREADGAGPSVQAYERYVRGRREMFQYGKASFDRAEELLNEAVEIDPTYGQAWAGLSQIAGMRFLFSQNPKTLERAVDLAKKGIGCDPQLADPWVWLGYAQSQQLFCKFRPEDERAASALSEAQRHIHRAFELDPVSPMAAYFAASLEQIGCRFAVDANDRAARRAKSLALYQRNLKIAPLSCWSWLGIGWVHLDLGNVTEAEWCLTRAVELEPKVMPPTAGVAVFLGEALRRIGKLEASREQSLRGLEATEGTDHMYRDTFRGVGLCASGRASLQLGDFEAATAAFRQAVLHLRGRTNARVGGQLLVQALAGLSRAGQGPVPFEEAVAIYKSRAGYEFGWLWWGWDEITLLELSRAARTLRRNTDAQQFLDAAVSAGSIEALADAGRNDGDQ